ncbi:hypothetical protein SCLCIDRAFT_1218338 [Scleroderma citrinum Foug A]|uniref:Uncharacterized protein n=1 Tax=Scleroderma citrinum Foug A TaxID=1036808 RepID=A0A0C3DRE2_9AGAM|nr:hypothetical protein SCLCIDRAFT_1218338 [Scleroderma citrinum Foug A]
MDPPTYPSPDLPGGSVIPPRSIGQFRAVIYPSCHGCVASDLSVCRGKTLPISTCPLDQDTSGFSSPTQIVACILNVSTALAFLQPFYIVTSTTGPISPPLSCALTMLCLVLHPISVFAHFKFNRLSTSPAARLPYRSCSWYSMQLECSVNTGITCDGECNFVDHRKI